MIDSLMVRMRSPGIWLLLAGLLFSALLAGLGLSNYRSARPLAEGILRGLALTLAATVEALANQDASLQLLGRITGPDIAYFALADESGIQLYHTNPELIGSPLTPALANTDVSSQGFRQRRTILGTGEEAFEFLTPVHVAGRSLLLKLVLHTYQADAVVRRAQAGLVMLTSLLAVGWVMGGSLYLYSRRAVRHRQEMAEQRHLARLGTLSAVLAHEVRNPLAGIKGYAQLLEEGLDGQEERQFASQVVAEAGRLEALVNDLLAYAQPVAARCQRLELGKLVELVCSLLAARAAEAQVTLVTGSGPWPEVLADGDRLQQLLWNLILNGLQATPAGGTVRVCARRLGPLVEIAVRDSGRGIAPADLERIFEPFFTRRARGTGLGLAICQRYAQQMGGTLTVASIPGEGSVFTLSLPVAEHSTADREALI